jgi:hypothetical protein
MLARGLAQLLSDRREQLVADVVAEPVVDGAELVDIEEEHRDEVFRGCLDDTRWIAGGRSGARCGPVEREAQPLEKHGTIGEAGERVVIVVEPGAPLIRLVLGQRMSELPVARRRGGELGEHLDVVLVPLGRLRIGSAEHAHRHPGDGANRHAEQ